jgi:hypothetical protein
VNAAEAFGLSVIRWAKETAECQKAGCCLHDHIDCPAEEADHA